MGLIPRPSKYPGSNRYLIGIDMGYHSYATKYRRDTEDTTEALGPTVVNQLGYPINSAMIRGDVMKES